MEPISQMKTKPTILCAFRSETSIGKTRPDGVIQGRRHSETEGDVWNARVISYGDAANNIPMFEYRMNAMRWITLKGKGEKHP